MSSTRSGADQLPPHLSREKPKPNSSTLDVTGRKYWCIECNRRVTRSKNKTKEYGHDSTCEHSVSVYNN